MPPIKREVSNGVLVSTSAVEIIVGNMEVPHGETQTPHEGQMNEKWGDATPEGDLIMFASVFESLQS